MLACLPACGRYQAPCSGVVKHAMPECLLGESVDGVGGPHASLPQAAPTLSAHGSPSPVGHRVLAVQWSLNGSQRSRVLFSHLDSPCSMAVDVAAQSPGEDTSVAAALSKEPERGNATRPASCAPSSRLALQTAGVLPLCLALRQCAPCGSTACEGAKGCVGVGLGGGREAGGHSRAPCAMCKAWRPLLEYVLALASATQKPPLACALAHRASFSLLKMLSAHSGPQASPAHSGRAVGGEDSATIAPAGRPIATGTPAQAPGQTTHTMRVVQVRWGLKRRAQGRASGRSQRQQRLSFVRSRPCPLADA